MTVKQSYPIKSKKYELVAPDGGWGYMIWVAVIVNFCSITAFPSCMGLIFNDFFIELGMDSTRVSLLNGINAVCIAVSGFLTGPLLKVLSIRQFSFLAAVMFNIGLFGTVFVKNQVLFFVYQGLFQNFGLGILFNLSFAILNDYFVEKRMLAMSFTQTFSAAASMVAPMIVKWTNEMYGFRGTLIMMSGVGLQTFVAISLMQPVAWHMKKVEIVEEDIPEMKLLLETANKDETLQTPTVTLNDPENMFNLEKDNEMKPSEVPKGKVIREFFKNLIDIELFKEFILKCSCFGATLCSFADVMYGFFLAPYLYSKDWTTDRVTFVFTLYALGDIATRILFTFTSTWMAKIGSHPIYIFGLVISVVTKLAILWTSDTTAVYALITVMGISRCTIQVLLPLVISECVSAEQFPSAMGITMMLFGFISIVMGPIIGAIRDFTGNYTVMFYVLISLMVFVIVVWCIEYTNTIRKNSKAIKTTKTDDIKIK